MTRCAAVTTTCDGLDPLPVKLGLRPDVLVLCAGCRRTAGAMGLRVVERRVAAVRVAIERRRFVPPWLANLRGRDETAAVLRP